MGWYYVMTQEIRESLEGKEADVFAVIQGFSQEGQGCFHGSLSKLSSFCGIKSKTTTQNILKSLVEKGALIKDEEHRNGVKFCSYTINPNWHGISKIDMGGISKIDTNNKDIDISTYVDNNTIREFPFKKALLDLGVSMEVAETWMLIRKKAKAVNSEIAFKAIKREIEKSGLTADQAIKIAVEKSWRGFDAAWLNKQNKTSQNKFEQIQETLLKNPFL